MGKAEKKKSERVERERRKRGRRAASLINFFDELSVRANTDRSPPFSPIVFSLGTLCQISSSPSWEHERTVLALHAENSGIGPLAGAPRGGRICRRRPLERDRGVDESSFFARAVSVDDGAPLGIRDAGRRDGPFYGPLKARSHAQCGGSAGASGPAAGPSLLRRPLGERMRQLHAPEGVVAPRAHQALRGHGLHARVHALEGVPSE